MTAIAGMESGNFPSRTKLKTVPCIKYGSHCFPENNKRGFGLIGYEDALRVSSNTFFYQVGVGSGSKALYDAATKLGFNQYTGVEIGILQSIREIPGFLAFTIVFVLLIIKEQSFSVIALAIMGLGVSLTGFFPTVYGLYFTTIIMSTGFHYFETIKNSLSLQWLSKEEAPQVLGKLIAVGSITSLILYGVIWFFLEILNI